MSLFHLFSSHIHVGFGNPFLPFLFHLLLCHIWFINVCMCVWMNLFIHLKSLVVVFSCLYPVTHKDLIPCRSCFEWPVISYNLLRSLLFSTTWWPDDQWWGWPLSHYLCHDYPNIRPFGCCFTMKQHLLPARPSHRFVFHVYPIGSGLQQEKIHVFSFI
jgi:hypothetical protein